MSSYPPIYDYTDLCRTLAVAIHLLGKDYQVGDMHIKDCFKLVDRVLEIRTRVYEP